MLKFDTQVKIGNNGPGGKKFDTQVKIGNNDPGGKKNYTGENFGIMAQVAFVLHTDENWK